MKAARAVSTVADVALAIFLLAAAMGVLVTFTDGTEPEHTPIEADHTAETITASTINASYHVEDAVEAYYNRVNDDLDSVDDVYEDTEYDEGDLTRVSHGPLAGHVTAIALTNVAFDGERLSEAADDYHRVVDETIQANLVNASFYTHVSARWEPFEDSSIRGRAEVGQTPPRSADVSAATITVPSGLSPVRADARDAVDDDDDYDEVAEIVARAIIERYLPELESKRALESRGLERDLVVYRYLRMAEVIEGATPEEIEANLDPHEANVTAANGYLTDALAAQIEDELDEFETAEHAAAAVSVSEVTLTVRTWEP